jgi:Rv0078B-related antitoxin
MAERFRTVADLWATGVALQRHKLRRTFPGASDHDIERRLNAWLHERPGAEWGDGPAPERR